MAENLRLVNPAVNTAKEFYAYLTESRLKNKSSVCNSEFYISVPSLTNPGNQMDDTGNFTHTCKYDRTAGDIQEYVKRISITLKYLNNTTIFRLQKDVPRVYQLIHEFNHSNQKLTFLAGKNKLSSSG